MVFKAFAETFIGGFALQGGEVMNIYPHQFTTVTGQYL
jgi:hypothetical protein